MCVCVSVCVGPKYVCGSSICACVGLLYVCIPFMCMYVGSPECVWGVPFSEGPSFPSDAPFIWSLTPEVSPGGNSSSFGNLWKSGMAVMC